LKKFNFYKIGLSLGLIPIIGLGLILFVFWFGLTFFAHDIDVNGIGFIYILASVPIVFVGFVLTIISIFKNDNKSIFRPIIGLLLIILNVPTLIWILRTHGEISGRAYLKVINNSDFNIDNITIKEPDNNKDFGFLGQGNSKVLFFNPDYYSPDGVTYPGIGNNYFLLTINQKTTHKNLPIIHPGETHKIIIDKNLNLTNIHLNKIEFNK
jgi:hypothetical protein